MDPLWFADRLAKRRLAEQTAEYLQSLETSASFSDAKDFLRCKAARPLA